MTAALSAERASGRDRGLLRHVRQTLGASVVIAVVGAAGGILAARWLGPEGRGELARLTLWPSLFVGIGNLGADLGATFYSSDRERRDWVPGSALAIVAVQSAVLVAVYLAVVPQLFPAGERGPAAYAMAAVIPVGLLGLSAGACLGGRLDFRSYNVARTVMGPAYVVGLAFLAAIGLMSSAAAAYVYLTANALAGVAGLWLVRRRQGRLRIRRDVVGALGRFGLRAFVGRTPPQSMGADLGIVAGMLTTRALGIYSVAIALLALPRMVSGAIAAVAFPHASARHHAGEPTPLRTALGLTLASSACAAAVTWAAAGPAVRILFGGDFAGAIGLVRILVLAEVARAAAEVLVQLARGVGRPGATSIAEGANWALFCGLAAGGAAVGGLHGLAWGTVIAAIGNLGALAFVLSRRGSQRSAPAVGPVEARG